MKATFVSNSVTNNKKVKIECMVRISQLFVALNYTEAVIVNVNQSTQAFCIHKLLCSNRARGICPGSAPIN